MFDQLSYTKQINEKSYLIFGDLLKDYCPQL